MNSTELNLHYGLCKQVPDMRRGFAIATAYGEILIDSDEAGPFADLLEKVLARRLECIA